MEVLTDSTQRQSDSSEKLYLEFSFIKYIYARTNILYIYTKKKGSFSKRLCQETSEVDEMAPSAFLGHSFKILI